ncbi:uncharacterized protein A4U43_C10F16480 [Asparagus officinalis]|uniref:Uncharacterized protein n=1 Tax=Asparagus officinalis TaxID=4686 RepID=A0A5P1E6H5_ASPOF|nr:uncharacterized protein A4U43_C10F16480 [Asparagus officinalis]
MFSLVFETSKVASGVDLLALNRMTWFQYANRCLMFNVFKLQSCRQFCLPVTRADFSPLLHYLAGQRHELVRGENTKKLGETGIVVEFCPRVRSKGSLLPPSPITSPREPDDELLPVNLCTKLMKS